MEQVEKSYPSRVFATAVIDINGKSVFITKYFKPLEPPEAVLELSTDKKIQMVCVLPTHVGGYLHVWVKCRGLQCDLHSPHNLVGDLQITSLRQFMIFVLQPVRKYRSLQLHLSPEVEFGLYH